MATKAQERQRELYRLKGSLSMVQAILSNAMKSEYFSKEYKEQLGINAAQVGWLLNDFNKEVGWKEK